MGNLKIRARLIILVTFMSAMLMFIGFIGWLGIEQTTQSMREIYEGSVDSIQGLNFIGDYYEIDMSPALHKLRNGQMSWEEAQNKVNTTLEKVAKGWKNYLKNTQTEEQRSVALQVEHNMATARESLVKLQEILKNHDLDKLIIYNSQELYPTIEPIELSLQELIDLHLQKTKSLYEVTLQRYYSITALTIISTIFGVLLGVLCAIIIIRSITTPLNSVVDVVDRMALGETSMPLIATGKDEMSQLINAMKNMVDSSNKMVDTLTSVSEGDLSVTVIPRSDKDTLGKALNNMIEKLRQTISDVQTEVRVLSMSTQEIVSSVSQASTGTAETAAAVTETTSTIEELRQTAHIAADNSKDVEARSLETVATLKTSEESLGLTIESLHNISEKGRIINDSILKLSEQSLAIGEIIGTVNDLAEQSNLLAVNAAIEAAKAGEQGKSFGVVAQEIRILAEQSKAATVQIRAILSDIQNATNAAVLAAEQGSKSVIESVTLSSQTNKDLQTLSASIAKVSQAAQQITVSSQQQLVAVDQVAVAMNSINDASGQHVDHMRQIETAVIRLNEAGRTLKSLTDQYQLQRQARTIRRIDASIRGANG